jgi:DNA-binding CsgD family transcriptional regulator
MSSFHTGCLNNPQAEKGSAFDDLLSLLTNREREVALLFMEVANDKSVARELGIALQTVRNQIASIQNKLRINSREELILLLLSMQRSQDYVATRA